MPHNAAAEAKLSIERLRSLLSYDPKSGRFLWLVTRSRRNPAGSIAGHICRRRGYCNIKIDGRQFAAHRLAWFMMTGHWPASQVDHRNLNTGDNRWLNLREATPSLNAANIRLKSNKAGLKGVTYVEDRQVYRARIKKHGKMIDLGRYSTAEAAHAAYIKGAAAHFGNFARNK